MPPSVQFCGLALFWQLIFYILASSGLPSIYITKIFLLIFYLPISHSLEVLSIGTLAISACRLQQFFFTDSLIYVSNLLWSGNHYALAPFNHSDKICCIYKGYPLSRCRAMQSRVPKAECQEFHYLNTSHSVW